MTTSTWESIFIVNIHFHIPLSCDSMQTIHITWFYGEIDIALLYFCVGRNLSLKPSDSIHDVFEKTAMAELSDLDIFLRFLEISTLPTSIHKKWSTKNKSPYLYDPGTQSGAVVPGSVEAVPWVLCWNETIYPRSDVQLSIHDPYGGSLERGWLSNYYYHSSDNAFIGTWNVWGRLKAMKS